MKIIIIAALGFLIGSNLVTVYLLATTKNSVEKANQECVELLDPIITKAVKFSIENDKLKRENEFLKIMLDIKTTE